MSGIGARNKRGAEKEERKLMLSITVEQMHGMHPCGWDKENNGKNYTRERVTELWGGKKSLTPLEISALDIPAADRLWVLLRPEIIPEKLLHELACQFAEYSLHIFEKKYPDDKRPRLAIEAKRAWIKGEISDEELSIARDAAGDAAWAARAAARAARAAAGYAAWAARDAARDAAWDAARAAARDAARAAEAARNAFLEMTRNVLKEAD